jgi:hypothetical protein
MLEASRTLAAWRRQRRIARRRDSPWPARAELFSRKKDDGVAEAALIAVAGLVRERAP